ncbi:hypothetical protein SAY87_002225 [Trapa incisa]|uniref:Transmembrane protein 131-like N-terminal domain-containing protein n=1 Tax=Trapa incisa TaxID=236973 RepID=A0AAN7JUG9_9MYRT|nr:hypothetical protein SAY87_002225 [Trapa incisa]
MVSLSHVPCMESGVWMIGCSPEPLSMTCSRRFSFHSIKAFCIIWLSWCIFSQYAVLGTCLISGIQEAKEEKVKCELPISDCTDVTSGILQGNSESRFHLGNEMFFFPSTLPGSSRGNLNMMLSMIDVEESASQHTDPLEIGCLGPNQDALGLSNSSWSTDYGMSNLLNGRVISCSLNTVQDTDGLSYHRIYSAHQNDLSSSRGPLFNHTVVKGGSIKDSENLLSSALDGSMLPRLEIEPPILNWGEKHLYIPSFAYLTVLNTLNDSILHVYQPYSTDSQFFPCNITEIILGPGEVASICFVFLPKSLGFSSAHLILQTHIGGFIVQAKGFAYEFPYGQAVSGSEITLGGKWRKNISLFNPFNETIFLEEIAIWFSVSLGNTSTYMDATCCAHECRPWESRDCSFPSIKDWFQVKTENADPSMMAIRTPSTWEIGPGSSKTVAEIDFSFGSAARIFGAFCMQLKKASRDEVDIVMHPVEAEIDRKKGSGDSSGNLTVSLEGTRPCDADEGIVTVSLRNTGSYVVSIRKIEVADSEFLHIKYLEGLLLFPRTTTNVALVSCTPNSAVSDMNKDCKLLLHSNDSGNPIEIFCKDIVYLCSGHWGSSVHHDNPSSRDVVSRNIRIESLAHGTHLLPHAIASSPTPLEELVLQNWKSQGISTESSVLEDCKLLFSVVQIGDHLPKWIRVRNPSEHPVVMQLVLNSMEVVDNCQDPVDDLRPVLSANSIQHESTSPARYGFSLAGGAQTEAYVHPHSTASFGPIIFHPSNRCEWRSSTLIRNNLTGVEWVHLQGAGGSYSFALIEISKPVGIIEFNLEVLQSLNHSLPKVGGETEGNRGACSNPVVKKLYAKNMGDFSLDVQKIRISGTDCELHGFNVQGCSHFVLKPGQSHMLLVSYMSDFSSILVHTDLELVLGSGIISIPMKASVPLQMLELCSKSLFWSRVKKLIGCFIVVAPFLGLLISIFLQLISYIPEIIFHKGKRDTVEIIQSVEKSSSFKGNNKSDKMSTPFLKVDLVLPADEEEPKLGDDICADEHESTPRESVISDKDSTMLVHNLKESEPLNLVSSESRNLAESSQPSNLMIKTRKESRSRRRKRKGMSTASAGLFEVSSSHSGNSTPSSPLSPILSITPRRTWPISSDGHSNPPVNRSAIQEAISPTVRLADLKIPLSNQIPWFPPKMPQPSPASGKLTNKPILLPSATFPSAGKPSPCILSKFLLPTSTIAPHARAPGSKLYGDKGVKSEENPGHDNLLTYDIWGDHLSGLWLSGPRSVDDSVVVPRAMNNDSESFFVRGPQVLMTKYQQESVSLKKDADA